MMDTVTLADLAWYATLPPEMQAKVKVIAIAAMSAVVEQLRTAAEEGREEQFVDWAVEEYIDYTAALGEVGL